MPGTILLADLERANDDELRQHLGGLLNPPAPTSSDSLTNPLGTGNAVPATVEPVAPPPELQEHLATLLAPPPVPLTDITAGMEPTTAPPPVPLPDISTRAEPTTAPPPVPLPSVPPAGTSVMDELASHVQQASGGALQLMGQGMTALGSGAQAVGQGGQNVISLVRPPAPAPTPTAAAPTSSDSLTNPLGLGNALPSSANPSTAEVRNYIVQAAQARGIDPDTALKVAQSEGGFEAARRGTFKTGSSWWPFQLHYGGAGYEQFGDTAGMGNQFTKDTGFAPGDPRAWQAATDYALDRAKQGGWGAWYGAKAQGITGFDGINRDVPSQPGLLQGAIERGKAIAQGAGEAVSGAVNAARGTLNQVSQFGDSQLTASEAAAACGPAAAVRFAQRYGRNPSLREATDLAASVGWTQGQGMAGIGSEKALLDKMGVATKLVSGPDWGTFANEARSGNPVIISTAGHYFTADNWDPATNRFHVGRSGLDLKGGSEWMTPEQMTSVMGAVQGGLLADNPTTPASTVTTSQGFTAPASSTDQQAAQVAAPQPLRIIGDAASGLGQKASEVVAGGLRVLDSAVEQASSGTLTPEAKAAAGQLSRAVPGLSALPPEQVGDVAESALKVARGPTLISDAEYAARPDAARWRALIERTDGQPATDAEVANLMRGADTGMAAAGNEPSGRRMFHGTGAEFARPEPGRFAEEGLFGPGYYLTSEPRVAGGIVARRGELTSGEPGEVLRSGYAQERSLQQGLAPDQKAQLQRVVERAKETLAGNISPELRTYVERDLAEAQARLDTDIRGQGANVRAVDVPQDTRLLDVDQPLAATDRQAIVSALRNSPDPRDVPIAQQFEELTAGADATGKSAYDILRNVNPRFANDVLQRAGFDGVTYEGGQRVPMAGLDGQPIQHQATVIFPESLDKLRNAISGTQGGEAAAPFAAGLGVAAGAGALATNLGGARDKLNEAIGGFTAPLEDLQPGGSTANAIGQAAADFTAPRFPGVGEAIGGALDSLSGPGAASDAEILRRAKPAEVENARGTVQGFNDAYTDKRGLPREEVSDADVAAYLRGLETAKVAAFSYAGLKPVMGATAATGAPAVASGADRLTGYMSSNMLLNPSSQFMNAVTQTEQTVRSPVIRAMAGYPDEAFDGVRMLGAASADGLRGAWQMLKSGTSRTTPGARPPVGIEAPGLRVTGAQDEMFRHLGGAQEVGMEMKRLVKENPGVPESQLMTVFDKELKAAYAKGGANAVFSEGSASSGLASQIAQWKTALINNSDPNPIAQRTKQGLGWLMYAAVPFSQMPETLLKTGVRRLPGVSEAIGAGETAAALARGDTRGARMKGAETALDGMINAAIVHQVLQGNITGPEDPEHPSRVRIGDQWFDYTSLGPLGLRMGATAAVVEGLKHEDNKLNPDKLGALFNQMGKVATNEWFLDGAVDTLSQIGQGGLTTQLGKQVQALGDRLVPAGGLLDYTNKSTDPLERNPSKELPNAIWERPESRIPGLSQFVPSKLDPTTGEPQRRIEQGPGAQLVGITTEQSDPAQAALADLERGGYSVSEPEAGPKSLTIAGAEVQLTPAERRVYEEARGKAIAQFAATMQTPEYQKGDDNYKARFWAAALSKASDVARAKVLGGMSEEERTKRIQEGFRTVGKLTPLTPEPTVPAGPPVVR